MVNIAIFPFYQLSKFQKFFFKKAVKIVGFSKNAIINYTNENGASLYILGSVFQLKAKMVILNRK